MGQNQGSSAVPPAPQTGRRILVVDDNKDAARSMGALLRLLGAEPRVAHDGPSALETFQTFQPQVVLLDLGMPLMDGFEVARRIRQDLQASEVVLVAVSGWDQSDVLERADEAGFNHHLVKPVHVDALQSLLGS